MTIINRERYYCSAKRERGTCVSSTSIKAVAIEERVLSGLKDILVGNEEFINEFTIEFKAEVARLNKQRGTRDRQIQKELNKITTAIKRCLTFIMEGDGDPGLVRGELRDLEFRKKDLERQLQVSDQGKAIEVHPNMAELYAKKVGELQTFLADEMLRPEAMEIIRSLIDHIEVHDSGTRDQPDVILVGALAAILDYTHQNKTAALISENGGRVLLVAGARNRRYLHIDFARI